MTRIELRGRETERRQLPMVCMVCGEPAVERLRKRFSWHPPWVIVFLFIALLAYVLVALLLTKQMGVDVPVCRRHRYYWVKKFAVFFGSFLAAAALSAGIIAAFAYLEEGQHIDVGGVACIVSAAAVVLWLVGVFFLQLFALRPVEITDRSITLANVSPKFIEAVEQDRAARAARRRQYDDDDGDEDEDDRPRRRRSRREDEDEPPGDRDSFRDRRDPDEPRRRRDDRDED